MKTSEKQKICVAPGCDTIFSTTNMKQKTCSPSCYTKVWRIEKRNVRTQILADTCALPGCHNKIDRPEKASGRPKLYCSEVHLKHHHYLKNFGTSFDEKVATCANPNCDDPKFIKKRPNQKYCCSECRITHSNNQRAAKQTRTRKQYDYAFENSCDYCGTKFGATRALTRFCGKSCNNMFVKQGRLPEWVTKGARYSATEDDALLTDLVGEIFIDCHFEYMSFNNTNLTRAKFIRCTFDDCEFIDSWFDGTQFIDCVWIGDVDLTGSFLSHTDIPPNAKLTNTKTSKAKRPAVMKQQVQAMQNKALTYYDI